MREKKVMAGIAIGISALFLIAGCGTVEEPKMSADEAVKHGLEKIADVKSYDYELSFSGDMKEQGGNTNFGITLAGAVDSRNMKDPKMSMHLIGSLNGGQDMSGSVDAELILVNKALYGNVKKVDLNGMNELLTPYSSMFSKWWMYELPKEAMDALEKSTPEASTDTQLTEQQKQIKEAYENANLFSNPKYVGVDVVKGQDSYKYSVDFNKENFVKFIQKFSEIQGEEQMNADMVSEMNEGMKDINLTGFVWVDANSGVMNQLTGNIKVAGDQSANLTFRLSLGNIDKDVSVAVPSGAETIPAEIQALFTSMMEPQPYIEMDSSFDPSSFDSSMMDLSDLSVVEQ